MIRSRGDVKEREIKGRESEDSVGRWREKERKKGEEETREGIKNVVLGHL